MDSGLIHFLFVFIHLYMIVMAAFKVNIIIIIILYVTFCSGIIQKMCKNMCNNLTFASSCVFD